MNLPSLNHELLDHAVKCRALISEALLARGQGTEVLRSLGNGLAVETNDDATKLFIAVCDIEVDL